MKKLFTSVAKTESIILRDWSDNQSQGYFTGVILDACEVFSICDGVIVQVEKSIEYFQVVTIQYSVNLYIRYLNLVELADNIVEGCTIKLGDHVGHTYQHKACIEVCTSDAASHKWPVRVGKQTMYKVDPLPYLEDDLIFRRYSQLHEVSEYEASNVPPIVLTPDMENEFHGMNRGEW